MENYNHENLELNYEKSTSRDLENILKMEIQVFSQLFTEQKEQYENNLTNLRLKGFIFGRLKNILRKSKI